MRRAALPRGARRAAALLAALGMIFAPTVMPAQALTPPAPEATTDTDARVDAVLPIAIELDTVTPSAVTPADELVVTGTLRNISGTAVTTPNVRLRLDPATLDTREQVGEWAQAGSLTRTGVPVGDAVAMSGELAPGSEVGFTLQVPPGGLGLPTDPERWGPRGLAVEVRGSLGEGGTERLGLARSHLVWFPGQRFEPVSVTTVVPITGPAPDPVTGYVDPDALAAEVAPGGRLDRVLAAADRPGTAWALDPALLASAARSIEPDSGTTPTTPPAETATVPADEALEGDGDVVAGASRVRQWWDRLTPALADHDLIALPWADTDVVALAGRDDDLLATATRVGHDALADVLAEISPSLEAATDVSWPADGVADEQTLEVAADQGTGAVVLGAAANPPRTPTFSTPSGRSDLTVDDAVLDGLLYDESLSALLSHDDAAGSAVPVQRALAETAAVVRELPGTPGRSLLLAAPRGWDPDPSTVQALLGALEGVPWLVSTDLSQLRATPAPASDRVPPALTPDQAEAVLPADHVEQTGALAVRGRAVASVLADPADDLADVDRAVSGLVSQAWREDVLALPSARADLGRAVDAVGAGVRVVTGSDINLFAGSAALPVTIVNDLSQTVTVMLALQPAEPRLSIEPRRREVVVEPGQQRVVRVPVRALANGSVLVDASLETSDGTRIGAVDQVRVQVQMNAENWALGVVGALAAVVVAVGLIRTIRGGRRRPRLGPADVTEGSV